MPNILVDETLCTKCNICSDVCIMGIIEKSDGTTYPKIATEKQAYCFKCGHCEAFCISKALRLDYTQKTREIQTFNTELDSETLALFIKNRRTIRHYSTKLVDKDLINLLMDTMRYSASGGNTQNVKYLLFYKREDVKTISSLTIDWMKSILNTSHPLANYVQNIVQKWDSGQDFISHNAPHLLIAHIPHSKFFYDPTDGIIALTLFDLLAPAYGLGSCWAGFIKMALASYEPLQEFINLPKDRDCAYPMLFGYPIYKAVNIPERNPLSVEWRI